MANKRRRIIWSKLLLYIISIGIFIVAVVLIYTGYKDWSMNRLSNADVLTRVGSHIILPKGEPKKIIRINNVDTLRIQNDFYKGIEEGDFIIIYDKRAYIYDSRHDILRDVLN